MGELFDVVDEADGVIGRVTRKEAHTQGHIHRSVLFFVFDEAGRVYVSQRTDDKEFYPGYWSVVFGGHVQAGERYEEAVARELKEEAGIEETPELMASFKKRFDALDRENVRVYAVRTKKLLSVDPGEIKRGEFLTMAGVEEKLKMEKFLPETGLLMDILRSYNG